MLRFLSGTGKAALGTGKAALGTGKAALGTGKAALGTGDFMPNRSVTKDGDDEFIIGLFSINVNTNYQI